MIIKSITQNIKIASTFLRKIENNCNFILPVAGTGKSRPTPAVQALAIGAARGDVLKALYVAAGSPAVEDTSILTRFKDASGIPEDMVVIAAWAAQNGILKGNTDGTAGLSKYVSRGQACALAGRTMGTLA